MDLITRIKERTKEKGINIKQLEVLAGLSNGQIGKWERQKPSYDKVAAVANSLNVSIDWLITGKEGAELSEEEQNLVNMYRAADDRGKRAILRTAESETQELASSTSKIG